jgi:hypothetical protein
MKNFYIICCFIGCGLCVSRILYGFAQYELDIVHLVDFIILFIFGYGGLTKKNKLEGKIENLEQDIEQIGKDGK